MGSRKRSRSEAVAVPEPQKNEEPGLLQRIRSSWEFANLMQYIAIFGKVMKIDEDFEIEDLEDECLKPEPSLRLLDIGLCMLKWVSSHRGLTSENFDEYTRRQYNAKAPSLENPFGHDEQPLKFLHFDVFTKLRVLHQLSVWTFWNPDRIREKMPETKESEQLQWRIEEFGYDREGRSYYVLDDNRLYRRTDPPIPEPPRPKKKAKSRSTRASRTSRRASALAAEQQSDNEDKTDTANGGLTEDGYKWECLAITLPEYQAFLETIAKSKDEDEVILRERIEEHVMPLLEKAEEAQQRKRIKREKELLNMQMLAGAKRSNRLAQKEERERAEKEAADAARKREADLIEARREQAKQKQLEKERQSRMMTREQRTRDREQKRILHEAELERITEEQEKAARGEGRVSARHLKAELEKSQKNLAELTQEDEWVFDCAGCGAYGENFDDGSHSVACEKCSVWQHSKCLGIAQEEAGKDDFHFICADCKRKEEESHMPKIPPLKFRMSSSASPQTTTPPTATKRKAEDEIAPTSPVKKTHAALANVQNTSSPHTSTQQPPTFAPSAAVPHSLPPLASQGHFYVPPSPERRSHLSHQTPLPSSSPPRQPFSPPKNGHGPMYPSLGHQPQLGPGPNILPPMQHPHMQPGPQLPPIGTFGHVRPSSSHSTARSPIQNQPAMSPTQGNRDVGPLAGFPHAGNNNGVRQWPPSFDNHTPRPQSGHGAPPSMSSNYPSFSASATPNGHNSSPPHSSHGMGMSGISPTKQSPRPMTSGNGMAGAPVLPPIRRLEPSPKLMGRSSPDAPIPPPIKCMTPEQEERRARENAIFHHGYAAHSQNHPMSSPSLNRIPPLGPAATQQLPEPIPSPQRGGDASRQ